MSIFFYLYVFVCIISYNFHTVAQTHEAITEQSKKNIQTVKTFPAKDLVTVDMIELILKYRSLILKMLYGTPRPDGSTAGSYVYGQQSHGIQSLALCEKYAKKDQNIQSALANALKQAKEDFLLKTEPFIIPAQKMKSVIVNIMSESYGAENSYVKLIAWQQVEEKAELVTFNNSVQSFATLQTICIEILHLLNALLERAPQAVLQLYERIEKWQKTKQFLSELEEEGLLNDSFDKKAFLRYVKQNYADLLLLGEFTKDQIEIILQEYIVRYT